MTNPNNPFLNDDPSEPIQINFNELPQDFQNRLTPDSPSSHIRTWVLVLIATLMLIIIATCLYKN